MINDKVKKGYEEEIKYQKHMLENLHRWFTLSFLISTVFVTLMYFFHSHLVSFIFCIIVAVIAIIATFIFGYGIYQGQKNINKVIDEFAYVIHSNDSSL